jgi:O-antigen/teichoic acid export membrane protein
MKNVGGITKGIVWLGGSRVISQFITWGLTIVVARLLTPEDYGLVAISGIFLVFAQAVSEMGIATAIIQKDTISDQETRALYSISLLLGLVMSLVGYIVAPFFSTFFDDTRLTGLIRFQSIVFFIQALNSVPRSLIMRDGQFDMLSKIELVARIGTSICAITMALSGFGVWALAAQGVIWNLLQYIAYAKYRWVKPAVHLKYCDIHNAALFGCKVMVQNIFNKVYLLLDVSIYGKLASKEFLGAYGFAKQFADVPFEKILPVINQVLLPYFSRKKYDQAQLVKWSLTAAELQSVFIISFYIIMFFCSKELINVLLGSHWEQAVLPMRIFCVVNVMKLVSVYANNILTALGVMRKQIWETFARTVVLGLGLVFIIHFWNVEKSLYIWFVVTPFSAFYLGYLLMQSLQMKFSDIVGRLRKSLFVHLGVILVYYFIDTPMMIDQDVLVLIFKLFLGVSSYFCLWLIVDSNRVLALISRLVLKEKSCDVK